jgi:hypothetical protein
VLPVLLDGVLLVLLLPGSIDDTDEPMLLAVSRTCSTTRLMTLRLAPPPDDDLLGRRAFDERFGVLLRAAVAFPPFRPAAERRALVVFLALFFAPPFFEERLDAERFFDDDRFLDELFDPRFFEDFFEDLREERFFDAAMFRLLLRCSVG